MVTLAISSSSSAAAAKCARRHLVARSSISAFPSSSSSSTSTSEMRCSYCTSSSRRSSFSSTSRSTLRIQPAQHQQPRRSIASTAAPSATVAPTSASTSQPSSPPAKWTPLSQRVGLLGVKMGMLSYFLPNGHCVPCSVVHIPHNEISRQVHFDPLSPTNAQSVRPPTTSSKQKSVRPYIALQVYAGALPPQQHKHSMNKSKGTFKEFRVSQDALLPERTVLSVSHFVPGQEVDVQGRTKGKGFQGPMKRHGFKGLRASHGVSISHRSHGSTGQHQDPGRVFPGKKMAGRMGGTLSSLHNLIVLRIDISKSLLFLKGNIPGPNGSLLSITDAQRSLVGKARVAAAKGRLRDGSLAKGDEGGAAYLPPGIEDLPFPAATKELEKSLPDVVEVSSL